MFYSPNLESAAPVYVKYLLLLFLGLFLSTSVHAAENATPVSIITAKTGQIREEIPLTGTVNSIRTVQVSAKEAGYVEAMLVDEGDKVNQGDVLMKLDRQLAELEVARVQAQIVEARARQKELERQRDEAAELLKKKHVAPTTYEEAKSNVEINKAVIQRLETELRRQRVIAERHQVIAPFSGVITEKLVEVGQWVNSNTALLNLIELEPLRIEVSVPQFYFNRIDLKTPVKLQYDAIPGESFTAQVSSRIPVSDRNARTFPIFIRIANAEQKLVPGMSARVTFQLASEEHKQALLLPRDTVVLKPDGSRTVWVVSSNGTNTQVQPVRITTGKNIKQNIEVTSGDISPGDRIIVKGNELLQPGQAVNVIETLDYAL